VITSSPTNVPTAAGPPVAVGAGGAADDDAIAAGAAGGLFDRLLDRWRLTRDRLLSDPGFQRWAAWFPLTRFFARWRAMRLFDLCAGFVYSQVLASAVKVGLLQQLRARPATARALAPLLGLPEGGTLRLLQACVALGLVERRAGGRFGLGENGALLLGNEGALRMIAHHEIVYRDLADPVALLRGEHRDTELRRFWSYGSGAAAPAAAYSSLMANSVGLITDDILEAFPFDDVAEQRRFLDVGGGEGAFIEAVAARAPHLELTLFDLPPVAERARLRLAALGDRVTVVGGDVMHDVLPGGVDVVSLIRVVHDHDDGPALQILTAARKALRPGGLLLLAEPMAGTPGAERMGDAYFGFYLMAMGQGRPRTEEELQQLLAQAGFIAIRRRATRRPMLTRMILAEAPRG